MKRLAVFTIAIILVTASIAVALTYKRVTPIPVMVDSMRILVIDLAQERINDISSTVLYADALAATGRTKMELVEGVRVDIVIWKTEAEAKIAELNAMIAPLVIE